MIESDIMSKKGFNPFKKKENVLPNQSGNVGIEQVNNIEIFQRNIHI